jgi:hypothetical protein
MGDKLFVLWKNWDKPKAEKSDFDVPNLLRTVQ